MKLASYELQGKQCWGAVVERQRRLQIVDGTAATDGRYGSVRQVLQDSALQQVALAVSRSGHAIDLDTVQLLPPVIDPSKVLAVGLNYAAHAAESGSAAPAAPIFFTRFADTLLGHGQAIVRPRQSLQLDFEGELALVIGHEGRHIPVGNALSFVAGYTCFNDVSVRDYQKESITAGKNFPATGPFGPWLVTADELPDPADLRLTTRLNGAVVQQASTSMFIHSVAELVAYVSGFTHLLPGDVIATGTPAGIGARRNPVLWMKPGDTVEVEISQIGILRNTVVDEAQAHSGL
ncbi:MAG: fumarylacetoacetate hydrolase family protein [Polaromonas sp.]|uniref:fumarylacetoacetate hydrolase family protein n=1 Tax=Polaromonas sp. TaxID=1869339 RepID=UPI0025F80E41|nr:fumarylacetoacetate hydrolase family protein [Polaromonas sp.]MBI2726768.1 fumarylacetoacetate hydrolase family protein [Polaromonas sp.]